MKGIRKQTRCRTQVQFNPSSSWLKAYQCSNQLHSRWSEISFRTASRRDQEHNLRLPFDSTQENPSSLEVRAHSLQLQTRPGQAGVSSSPEPTPEQGDLSGSKYFFLWQLSVPLRLYLFRDPQRRRDQVVLLQLATCVSAVRP